MRNWKKLSPNSLSVFLIIGLVLLFFHPFIISGKIPIPADTIVGLYHPWRDVVWDNFTAGVPYKNFLITDPVRQQYVWRNLAVEQIRSGMLPLWNPYSFSGTPLLANFQSAALYPLNFLFIILPFNHAWGVLVFVQPLLAAIFLFLYLRFMNIAIIGSFIGSLAFAFSGFSIAWLEWNTIGHTALWLPLSLLSIEKIIFYHGQNIKLKNENAKLNLRNKRLFIWMFIFTFSLICSFLAGHLQVFFYSFTLINIYLLVRIIYNSKKKKELFLLFAFCILLFVLITSIQWLPTIQFISQSARDYDQGSWLKEGWFMPWQNLIQFISPDFFGNPATNNYWGVWNYGEFIGYIGILPLVFAIYAFFFRKDKKTLFFGSLVFIGLLLTLPTPIAKLPYLLNIPYLSSSQPTRLIFIIDFALSVLAAFGIDRLIREKDLLNIIKIYIFVGLCILFTWAVAFNKLGLNIIPTNLDVSKRNLILPTILFITSFLAIFSFKKIPKYVPIILGLILISDLFRFGWKFTPFSNKEWIFPQTNLLRSLSERGEYFRIMSLDRRIMPANFSVFYHLQDVSGYDPLYSKLYNQFVASWERSKPDITPASFNRIVTPTKLESAFTDLIGIKYILSFGPIKSEKLTLVDSEGQTFLYENKNVFPRAFFVENVVKVENDSEAISKMYQLESRLRNTAVLADNIDLNDNQISPFEKVSITSYKPNSVKIETKADYERLLVLTDIYYPSWNAYIDGSQTKLFRVDFAFRGVIVPAGGHTIEFISKLL